MDDGGMNQATYSVNSVHFLSPFILFPLDPMLVEVIEKLVDIIRSLCISVPLLRVEFKQLDIRQTLRALYIRLIVWSSFSETGSPTSLRLRQCSERYEWSDLYKSAPCRLAPPRPADPNAPMDGRFCVQKSYMAV